MTLSDLSTLLASGGQPAVEVRSVDLSLVVAYVVTADGREPLTNARGQTLQYPSRFAALRALKQTGLTSVEAVHVSAYDEMIGVSSQTGVSEMRERIQLAHISDR